LVTITLKFVKCIYCKIMFLFLWNTFSHTFKPAPYVNVLSCGLTLLSILICLLRNIPPCLKSKIRDFRYVYVTKVFIPLISPRLIFPLCNVFVSTLFSSLHQISGFPSLTSLICPLWNVFASLFPCYFALFSSLNQSCGLPCLYSADYILSGSNSKYKFDIKCIKFNFINVPVCY
ncbi:hypothetical protein L9F63_023441, partial [Diploptera punctata]